MKPRLIFETVHEADWRSARRDRLFDVADVPAAVGSAPVGHALASVCRARRVCPALVRTGWDLLHPSPLGPLVDAWKFTV